LRNKLKTIRTLFCNAQRSRKKYWRKKHQQSEDTQPLLEEEQQEQPLLEEEQQEDLMDVEYEKESASSKGKAYNICNKKYNDVCLSVCLFLFGFSKLPQKLSLPIFFHFPSNYNSKNWFDQTSWGNYPLAYNVTKGVVSRNAFELNLVNRIFYPG
jgi:hypothetical protein